MKLTLDQNEIEQAIIAYARNCITLAEGTSISVDMTAGRGPNGFSATLDITPGVAKAKPVYRLPEVADVNLPEVIAQQPMPGLRTPVAGIPRSIEDEPKVTEPVAKAEPAARAKASAKVNEVKTSNPFAKAPEPAPIDDIQADLEAADMAGNQEPKEPEEAPVEEPATEASKATSIFGSKAAASSEEAPAEEAPKRSASIFSKAAASGA